MAAQEPSLVLRDAIPILNQTFFARLGHYHLPLTIARRRTVLTVCMSRKNVDSSASCSHSRACYRPQRNCDGIFCCDVLVLLHMASEGKRLRNPIVQLLLQLAKEMFLVLNKFNLDHRAAAYRYQEVLCLVKNLRAMRYKDLLSHCRCCMKVFAQRRHRK